MTALVGDTVERTFSEVARFSTGLPGLKTHEPGGQDFGDFRERRVRRGSRVDGIHPGRLKQIHIVSSLAQFESKTNER